MKGGQICQESIGPVGRKCIPVLAARAGSYHSDWTSVISVGSQGAILIAGVILIRERVCCRTTTTI
jgi:hypothetical protein